MLGPTKWRVGFSSKFLSSAQCIFDCEARTTCVCVALRSNKKKRREEKRSEKALPSVKFIIIIIIIDITDICHAFC